VAASDNFLYGDFFYDVIDKKKTLFFFVIMLSWRRGNWYRFLFSVYSTI